MKTTGIATSDERRTHPERLAKSATGSSSRELLSGVPYRETAGLLFLFVFLVVLVLASQAREGTAGAELSQSLITELVGFFLTAVVVGGFVHRENTQTRRLTAERRRTVAVCEARRVRTGIDAVMSGTQFGPQYLPRLLRLKYAVERLDLDLTNLWLVESQEAGVDILEAQGAIRSLLDEILAIQGVLETSDRPVPFPSSLQGAIQAARRALDNTLRD